MEEEKNNLNYLEESAEKQGLDAWKKEAEEYLEFLISEYGPEKGKERAEAYLEGFKIAENGERRKIAEELRNRYLKENVETIKGVDAYSRGLREDLEKKKKLEEQGEKKISEEKTEEPLASFIPDQSLAHFEELKDAYLKNEISPVAFTNGVNKLKKSLNGPSRSEAENFIDGLKKEADKEWRERNLRKEPLREEQEKKPEAEESKAEKAADDELRELKERFKDNKEGYLAELNKLAKEKRSAAAAASGEEKKLANAELGKVIAEIAAAQRMAEKPQSQNKEPEEDLKEKQAGDKSEEKIAISKEAEPAEAIKGVDAYSRGLREDLDRKKNPAAGKAETLEAVAERKKAFEEAAQAVVEAEARLAKAEKNKKRFGELFSIFKKKKEGQEENQEENSEPVSEELQNARDALKEAKDKYNSLTKQYVEEAFQDEAVDKEAAKFNSIKGMIDAKILLEDKRFEEREKQADGGLLGRMKKIIKGYHKLHFKYHLAITGGLILASVGAPLAIGTALSGAAAISALALERIVSTIGMTATTEAMIDKSLVKHRKKKGQTIQAEGEKLAQSEIMEIKNYKIIEDNEDNEDNEDDNVEELKPIQFKPIKPNEESINISIQKFLDEELRIVNGRMDNKIKNLRALERRQNIHKWMLAGMVGALFATGTAQKAMAMGFEKVKETIKGKGAIKGPEAPAPKPSLKESSAPKPSARPEAPADTPFRDAIERDPFKSPLEEYLEPIKNIPKSEMAEKIIKQGEEAVAKAGKELIAEAKKGDSIWSLAKNNLKEQPWFNDLTKGDSILENYVIDSAKRGVLNDRRLVKGIAKEGLRIGEEVNLGIINDPNFVANMQRTIGGRLKPGSAVYEQAKINAEKAARYFLQQAPKPLQPMGPMSKIAETAISPTASALRSSAIEPVSELTGTAGSETFNLAEKAAGRIPTAAEKILGENLGGALRNITQDRIDKLGMYSAENFLKNANPMQVDAGFISEKGRAFQALREAAQILNQTVKPKRNETFINWVNRAKELIGKKGLHPDVEKLLDLNPLKNPKFYDLENLKIEEFINK